MKALLHSSLLTPLLTLVALFILLPADATACSCSRSSPCEAFNYASAVFIGKVVGGSKKVSEFTKDGKRFSVEAGDVRVLVEESFKGVTETEVIVTGGYFAMCGPFGFVPGERYVFYTEDDGSTNFFVGMCSATIAVKYAKEDLDFLHSLPKPGVGGRVFGQIKVDLGLKEESPLAGVKVVLSNEQHSYEATTDKSGQYEIRGVVPGDYQIRAHLPDNYTTDDNDDERELSVEDRGCVSKFFSAEIDSRLNGRVLDLLGHPAPARLTLVSVTDKEQKFPAYAGDDGEFQVEGIAPGRYLLFLDIYSAGKAQLSGKEERYYFPGTTERERAAVIEIRMGEKLTDYTIKLPEKLKAHTIRGVVQTPEGKPAANARVMISLEDKMTPNLYRTDDWGGGKNTDEQGRFEFVGFAGNTYSLEAMEEFSQAYKEKRRPRFSEKVVLKLDKQVDDLKLVVTKTKEPDGARPQQKTATPTPPKQ
jgi:hypothetical protein